MSTTSFNQLRIRKLIKPQNLLCVPVKDLNRAFLVAVQVSVTKKYFKTSQILIDGALYQGQTVFEKDYDKNLIDCEATTLEMGIKKNEWEQEGCELEEGGRKKSTSFYIIGPCVTL